MKLLYDYTEKHTKITHPRTYKGYTFQIKYYTPDIIQKIETSNAWKSKLSNISLGEKGTEPTGLYSQPVRSCACLCIGISTSHSQVL